MNDRIFKLFPDQKFFTIPELEKRLQYRHLYSNLFETSSDKEKVKQKGLEQVKKGLIAPYALEWGATFKTEILKAFIPNVSIRWIHPSVGYGLFAEETIEKDQYVGEYTGIIRRNNRRYFEPLNGYCYEYPIQDEIGRSYVIDATAGCLTRFINHSTSPNLKPYHVYKDGFYHLIFLALKGIEVGAQLLYDYGESYWYLRESPASLS